MLLALDGSEGLNVALGVLVAPPPGSPPPFGGPRNGPYTTAVHTELSISLVSRSTQLSTALKMGTIPRHTELLLTETKVGNHLPPEAMEIATHFVIRV